MASSSKNILSLVPSGKKAPNVAAEKIDERVLRLLGIEAFEVEMDYDTYKDALREFMAKGRASKTEIPSEEVERVTNEWKRVKSKKGRFVAKKKVIKAENIKSGGGVGVKTTTVSAQKLLPGTAEPQKEKVSVLEGIKTSLDSIANVLKQKNKFDRKQAADEEKDAKRSRREKILGGLKKGVGVIAKAADKILGPVKSIFQRIFEFFIKMVLGRALIKMMQWLGDKKNQGKVKSIIRFFEDWWPALLGGYILFGTGFGSFIGSFIPMIGGWIVKLVSVVASNPWLAAAAAGVGLFAAGALIPKMLPGTVDAEERKTEKKVEEQGEDTVRSQLEQQANNPNLWQRLTGESAEAQEQLHKLDTGETKRYAGGGSVFGGGLKGGLLGSMFGPLGMLLGAGLGSGKVQDWLGGLVSGEKGVDKIPAMLSDNEFVMSAGAVRHWGVDQMEQWNAAGGGTNRPTMMKGTTYASGGGLVGGDEPKDRPSQKQSPGAWYKNKLGQIYVWQAPIPGSQGFWMKSNRPGVGSELKPPKVEVGDININTSGSGKLRSTSTQHNVMAPRGGRPGYLNIKTGKWTPRNWSDAGKKRYKEIEGLPDLGGGGAGTNSLTEQAKVKTWNSAILDFLSGDDGKSRRARKFNDADQYDRKSLSEWNLSKALQVKKASQARLDKLSNEGKAHRSFTSWNQKKGIHEVKGRGKRFDAEENARQESIQKRGGWWGQFTRMMTTDRGYTDNKGNWRDLNVEDKAATARIKQAGAAAIGKYYSSSDGKYYGNYQQAVDAREERLAVLAKDQAASKKQPPGQPAKPAVKVNTAASSGGAGGGGGVTTPSSQATTESPTSTPPISASCSAADRDKYNTTSFLGIRLPW